MKPTTFDSKPNTFNGKGDANVGDKKHLEKQQNNAGNAIPNADDKLEQPKDTKATRKP